MGVTVKIIVLFFISFFTTNYNLIKICTLCIKKTNVFFKLFCYLSILLIFYLAYKGDLMMDFFLDDSPHDGFNQGKKIAKEKSQEAKTSDGEDTIEKIFVKINSHLTPEVAKGTNACFLFVVKGN